MTDPILEMTYVVAPERLPAVPAQNMTEAQKRAAAEISAGPRGSIRGPFWPLLRSPELMGRVQKVGEYLRFQCPLDMRLREIAALMAARSWTQQYEWAAHVPHALKAGVAPALIEAIGEGRRPAGMAEDEEIVHHFVTELLANQGVSDPTYERALALLGEAGVVDLTCLVGYYTLLAMIMNVARTALPDGRALPLAPLTGQIKPKS